MIRQPLANALRVLQLVLVLPLSIAEASPTDTGPERPPGSERRFAVGYKRGTGLGNYGSSISYSAAPNITIDLQVFALYDDGQRGLAVAPSIQVNVRPGYQNTPYLAAGLQYARVWFGNAAGGGFGAFATAGWEWKLRPGLGLQLGAGLHARQEITATDAMVSITQRGTVGLHWDLAVRYWF